MLTGQAGVLTPRTERKLPGAALGLMIAIAAVAVATGKFTMLVPAVIGGSERPETYSAGEPASAPNGGSGSLLSRRFQSRRMTGKAAGPWPVVPREVRSLPSRP